MIEQKIDEYKQSTMSMDSRYKSTNGKSITEMADGELALYMQSLMEAHNHVSICQESSMINSKQTFHEAMAEMRKRYDSLNSIKWPYIYAPYFTEQEILEQRGSSITQLQRGELVTITTYPQKIKELELQLKATEDPRDIRKIKNQLIDLGWNPSVDYTAENSIKAKERIEAQYTNQFRDCIYLIDASYNLQQYVDQNRTPYNRYNAVIPINIILSENNRYIVAGDIDTDASFEEAVTVYSFFMKSEDIKPGIVAMEFDNKILGVFPLTEELTLMKCVRNICPGSIVKRLYSGILTEDMISNINSYNNRCSYISCDPSTNKVNGLANWKTYISNNL